MNLKENIVIKELEYINKPKIKEIARLHIQAFPNFFLTKLGLPFLETLYRGYIEDKESGIIIAENNNILLGFVAYSKNYPCFFKKLLKNHLCRFALYSVFATIKNPKIIKKLLFAFKKSKSVERQERYVQIGSLCVSPDFFREGIGSLLISYIKKKTDFHTYSYINLETDAINNEIANNFYKKNGFELSRKFITNEGREMNEYRFLSKEKI